LGHDGKIEAIWGDNSQGTWSFDVANQFLSVSKEIYLERIYGLVLLTVVTIPEVQSGDGISLPQLQSLDSGRQKGWVWIKRGWLGGLKKRPPTRLLLIRRHHGRIPALSRHNKKK
jgi:hypothetical protein